MRLDALERKTLYEVFAAYRLCKILLDREVVPHGVPQAPKPGYEDAMDPELIKVERVFGPAPPRLSLPMLTPEENGYRRFVWRVDNAVRRKLSNYQRRIIRMRFLGKDVLTDKEVYDSLYQSGWYESFRSYERQKGRALSVLSIALEVAIGEEEIPESSEQNGIEKSQF